MFKVKSQNQDFNITVIFFSSRKSSASSETSTSDKGIKTAETVDKEKEKVSEKPATDTLKPKEKEDEQPTEEAKILTPFEELVRAATIMNPKVFELPREMSIFSQFPGEDKSKLNRTNLNNEFRTNLT